MSEQTPTPECDRLAAIRGESVAILNFLEWCDNEGIELACRMGNHDTLVPISKRHESVVMDSFGIDQNKLEEERRAMLDELRRSNESREGGTP